jgi:hypothetical protein
MIIKRIKTDDNTGNNFDVFVLKNYMLEINLECCDEDKLYHLSTTSSELYPTISLV